MIFKNSETSKDTARRGEQTQGVKTALMMPKIEYV